MDLLEDSAPSAPPAEEPAAPRRGRPPKSVSARPKVPRFDQLGELPIGDPLAMNEWMHRALGVSAAQVVNDPDLTDSKKRAELCTLAQRMAALTPQSRIHGAERAILGEHEGLSVGDGPRMEPVDASISATERAALSGGKARRGRPRKRPVG